MEEKIGFARPGGVVFGAGTELAIPHIATARSETRIFLVSVSVGKIFAERLRCDAVTDEVKFSVAINALGRK